MESSHVNQAFADEVCDCGSSTGTSDGYSEKSYEPDWVDKIGPRGDLFYVEPSYQQPVNAKPAAKSSECSASQTSSSTTTTKSSRSDVKRTLRSLIGKKKAPSTSECDKPDNSESERKNRIHLHDLLMKAECQEIHLHVDPKRHNYGRRATLCEALFGIIPGRLPSQLAAADMLKEGAPIMVQGLLPDGEAIKTGAIKIGDVLKSIDDFDVNEDNISFVLRNITKPQKVKLVLLRLAQNTLSDSVKFPFQHNMQQQSVLMKHLTGDSATIEETKQTLRRFPHAFLYQELHNDSTKPQEPNPHDEHVYQYPEYDNSLSKLRGMFVTLSSVLRDITSSKPRTSTLTISDFLVHVSYFHEANGIAILALPAICASAEQVQEHINEIISLLRLQYSSLSLAFRQTEGRDHVDRFFHLFFYEVLQSCKNLQRETFTRCLPCAAWLSIPSNIQTKADAVLSELESSDFGDMTDAFCESQRLYTFVGTCVFYKGYLLANHLPKLHFEKVFLFCRHYQLLRITSDERVGQIVVWKEVYLPKPENSETHHFLLVTGLRHSLLCAVLEVGGCSAVPEANPAPNLFYTDQAQNTLLQLESNGVISAADTCIEHRAVTLDPLCSRSATPCNAKRMDKSFSSTNLSLTGPPSPKRWNRNLDRDTCHLLHYSSGHLDCLDNDVPFGRSHSSCENFANGSCPQYCSVSTGSDCDSRASGSDTKFGRIATSSYDLTSLRQSLEDCPSRTASPVQPIVPGGENLIFHYLHLELAEGIYVAPTESASSLDHEILDNFGRSCLAIRKVLQASSRMARANNEEAQGKFGMDRNFSSVKEHGVLFTCSHGAGARAKGKRPASYWVVGRLFPDKHQSREVYVCIHENASASALEMAFRLSFGRQI